MWNLVIITVLASLVGLYANRTEDALAVIKTSDASEVAENMGLYREAVIQYYTANDLKSHSVSLDTLKTANMLPTWSTLYTQSANSIWDNYRDADGIIYIYATRLPSINIQAELATLSRNSYLAGVYRSADKILFSSIFGDTGIPLTSLATRSVPDNAPVWIAYRR